MLKGKKILIGISGGIAAYKVCSLVRLFVKEGAEVRVIMTPSAVNFVSPVTLSALSKNEVIINMFPEGETGEAEKVETSTWHVNLGLWADIFIVAPATANTIGKIVQGISDNFLLSTVLASRCSIVIAPTMDDDMYKNEITQENIKKLKERGFGVIDPEAGELASGLIGMGRMAESEDIFENIKERLLRLEDLKGRKILVTAGPTLEYLDSVRYITNHSTGKMGFEIARAAKDRGAEVVLVTGKVNLDDIHGVSRIDVETSDEMFDAVKKNMKDKDLIVMTAAVEDFKPVNPSDNKMKKEALDRKFTFEFTKAVDILNYLGENKEGFRLAGFALETDNGLENARDKLERKNLDFIVLNNPNEEGAGFGGNTNVVTLVDKDSAEKLPKMSKYEVGNAILDRYLRLK